jgi:hypothetical protein
VKEKHQVPLEVGVRGVDVMVAVSLSPLAVRVPVSSGVPVAGHVPGVSVDEVLVWQV